MTTARVTTRVSAAKDLHPVLTAPVVNQRPTPISRTFAELNDAVDSAIGLERDLSHAMSWDPATSGFFEAAENQWQDCLRLASDVFFGPDCHDRRSAAAAHEHAATLSDRIRKPGRGRASSAFDV